MELDDLKRMWQEKDDRLEDVILLNPDTLNFIQAQKVKSMLTPFIWQRSIELAFHTAAIISLSVFCYYNYGQWPYETSACMLVLFYSIAFTNCIRQLKVIASIDIKNDTVSVQSSLARIRLNSINFVRLSVLFIPALLSFPVVIMKAIIDLKLSPIWHFDIIKQSNGSWWHAQLITFVILIPLGLWFYSEVDYKNAQKKWVARLIDKASGTGVTKAIDYIKELEALKRDRND